MVRARVDRLDQDAEKTEQDGHLDNERTQAPHRVNPALPVQPHSLLGYPLPVPAVAFLYLSQPGLQVGHRFHLAELLNGQGKRYEPHDNSENDDGDSHVVEADGVKHHKQVQHGPDYYFSPEVVDTQEGLPCRQDRNIHAVLYQAVHFTFEPHQRQASS